MNRSQRVALFAGTLLFLGTGLFPPWEGTRFERVAGERVERAEGVGAAFLFRPPSAPYGMGNVRVDTLRLAVLLLLVAAATGSAIALLADRQGER